MRVLIISDIHANFDALQTVLKDGGDVDQTWCLGDLVGYGPQPNECVELIRSLENLICIKGNHDLAVTGGIDISLFNNEAKESMLWHQNNLSKENIKFLKDLPEKVEVNGVTLVHGSPRNPIWEYILEPYIARINYEYFKTDLCLVGHSHQPMISAWNAEEGVLEWGPPVPGSSITLHNRMIINPGSVGQPRDSDPRAAYAIYTTGLHRFEFRRIAYDVGAVQKKILKAELPLRHAQRLNGGW